MYEWLLMSLCSVDRLFCGDVGAFGRTCKSLDFALLTYKPAQVTTKNLVTLCIHASMPSMPYPGKLGVPCMKCLRADDAFPLCCTWQASGSKSLCAMHVILIGMDWHMHAKHIYINQEAVYSSGHCAQARSHKLEQTCDSLVVVEYDRPTAA